MSSESDDSPTDPPPRIMPVAPNKPRRVYTLDTIYTLRHRASSAPPEDSSLAPPILDPSASERWTSRLCATTNRFIFPTPPIPVPIPAPDSSRSMSRPTASNPSPASSPPGPSGQRLVPLADNWLRPHPLFDSAESAALLDGALEPESNLPPRRPPRRSPPLHSAAAPPSISRSPPSRSPPSRSPPNRSFSSSLPPLSLSSKAPPGFGPPPGFGAVTRTAQNPTAKSFEKLTPSTSSSATSDSPHNLSFTPAASTAAAPPTAAAAGLTGTQIMSLAKRRVAKGPGHCAPFAGRIAYLAANPVPAPSEPAPPPPPSTTSPPPSQAAATSSSAAGSSEIDRLFASATGAKPAPLPRQARGSPGDAASQLPEHSAGSDDKTFPSVAASSAAGGVVASSAATVAATDTDTPADAVDAAVATPLDASSPQKAAPGLAQWFAALGSDEQAREISPMRRSSPLSSSHGSATDSGVLDQVLALSPLAPRGVAESSDAVSASGPPVAIGQQKKGESNASPRDQPEAAKSSIPSVSQADPSLAATNQPADSSKPESPQLAPDVLSFFNRVQSAALSTDPAEQARAPAYTSAPASVPKPAPVETVNTSATSRASAVPFGSTKSATGRSIPFMGASAAAPSSSGLPASLEPRPVSSDPAPHTGASTSPLENDAASQSASVTHFFNMFKQAQATNRTAPPMVPQASSNGHPQLQQQHWPSAAMPAGLPPASSSAFPYAPGTSAPGFPGFPVGAGVHTDARISAQSLHHLTRGPAVVGGPAPAAIPVPQQFGLPSQAPTPPATASVPRTR